jgi:hypothetical protein
MRVSTNSDRQVLDLQRDALLAAAVDELVTTALARQIETPLRTGLSRLESKGR